MSESLARHAAQPATVACVSSPAPTFGNSRAPEPRRNRRLRVMRAPGSNAASSRSPGSGAPPMSDTGVAHANRVTKCRSRWPDTPPNRPRWRVFRHRLRHLATGGHRNQDAVDARAPEPRSAGAKAPEPRANARRTRRHTPHTKKIGTAPGLWAETSTRNTTASNNRCTTTT